MSSLDDDLRAITLNSSDNPPPKTLRLGEMFDRVQRWGEARSALHSADNSHAEPSRPSSPLRAARDPHPLPISLPHDGPSPLARLMTYNELLPLLLRDFEHPRELATLCRVNKGFRYIAERKLYRRVWLRPWEEGSRLKLVRLFRTLSNDERLCKLVKHLDVRFFPLAARGGDRYDLDEEVRTAIKQMSSLESLVWTRDKSLNPDLMQIITSLPNLRQLEVSGHAYRYYDPKLIGGMSGLEDLRVMMPDSLFRDALLPAIRQLASRPGGGLRGLAIIHRNSPMVDDDLLKLAAPSLSYLKRLNLWGCTRITKDSIMRILQEAQDIEELSLDAMPHSDLLDMSDSPELTSLHTYSLSITAPHRTSLILTISDLPKLPPCPDLVALHLTLSGGRAFLPADFLLHLQPQLSFFRLERMSILNLFISPDQLSALCKSSPNLVELFISSVSPTILETATLHSLALETFHITGPERTLPRVDALQRLAESIETLEQIGASNRVYEVYRSKGVELGRWSRTQIPRYFQIWRG